MRKTSKKKINRKVSHRKCGKSSFWHSLTTKTKAQIKNGLAILICTILLSTLYIYFVSPFVLRWKGVYSETTYPHGYSIRGIDISHYQEDIDWAEVCKQKIADAPISFAFIKATEGQSIVDKYFKTNFYQAREYGITRGAYHYFIPGISAEQQAQNYINTVTLENGDLPPVLDIEVTGNLDAEQLRKEALSWLQIIENKYNITPILYTNYKFKKEYLNTQDFKRYPYWIAHYYVDTLQYSGEWKFWQHTDRGKINGIKGYVDLNIFNGSMYKLQQLTLTDKKK